MSDTVSNSIKIPSNLQKFFFDYGHSKFIECNKEVAEEYKRETNDSFHQDPKRNNQVMPCLIYLTSMLESMYKRYWFSAGTLLGLFDNYFI